MPSDISHVRPSRRAAQFWRLPVIVAVALLGCSTPNSRLDSWSPATRGEQAAPPATPVQQQEWIRVGAWNIEWLGSPERRSGPARNVSQRPEDLADYILAARVDVLGLAEIARTAPDGSSRSAELDATFAIVSRRSGAHWQHRLFPARSGRDQNVGIAWNAARVSLAGPPRKITEPKERNREGALIWARPPWGQMFSAGAGLTDFVVVPVHKKSNYGGDYSEQRAAEARWLLADLPRAFDDPDVIIIGDWNCSSHAEPAIGVFVAAGFVDLNQHDEPTHVRYGPLDRAVVPAAQPEFAARRFEVIRESFCEPRGISAEDFKRRFSDHYMVVVELAVMPDDD